MSHDPLCPYREGSKWEDVCPTCNLIAKVREQERRALFDSRLREVKPYADGYADGQREAIAAAVQLVEALPGYALRDTCVSAMKGEQR